MSADLVLRMAANRPFIEGVERLMAERGLTKNDLQHAVLGRNPDGTRSKDTVLYKALQGRARLAEPHLSKLADVLGVPATDLAALYPPGGGRYYAPRTAVKPARSKAEPPTHVKPRFGNHFNIVTEDDGTLTVSCRVVGLTVSQALALGQSLVSAMPTPSTENPNV